MSEFVSAAPSEIAAKLAAKSRRDDDTGCLEWVARVGWHGYGQIGLTEPGQGRKNKRAHRVAYEVAHGPIPAGLSVCHRCDNRRCIEPTHLFLGTQSENLRDMYAKGRGREQRGEKSSSAKLSQSDALAIRGSSEPQRLLAKRFGVTQQTISKIKLGQRWATVPEPGR